MIHEVLDLKDNQENHNNLKVAMITKLWTPLCHAFLQVY